MSASPLVDAHVINTPNPWLHAEAARGIEIQLRKEIAALNRKVESMESAINDIIAHHEREIGQVKHRIKWLKESKGDRKP